MTAAAIELWPALLVDLTQEQIAAEPTPLFDQIVAEHTARQHLLGRVAGLVVALVNQEVAS